MASSSDESISTDEEIDLEALRRGSIYLSDDDDNNEGKATENNQLKDDSNGSKAKGITLKLTPLKPDGTPCVSKNKPPFSKPVRFEYNITPAPQNHSGLRSTGTVSTTSRPTYQ